MSENSVAAPAAITRKPSNSGFKQQRLPAWQPILTAGTVLPTFFIIGIVFIPIGIGLLYFSNNVQELLYDYTNCKNEKGDVCAEVIEKNIMTNCICTEPITISEGFLGDVFIYYGLSNFYQNHRRYVKSRDDAQLNGKVDPNGPSSECSPFDRDPEGSKIFIVPCGAIANSMFNDTITLVQMDKGASKTVPVHNTGIAWSSDKQWKFQNPPNMKEAFQGYVHPKNWRKNIWELDLNNTNNNGFQNEDFIVWMRTAALPTFRKLYRILDRQVPGFNSGLPAGNYSLKIQYNYPVKNFSGTKRVIISTTSLLGGKNQFLGIGYIVVGCIVLTLGVVFLIIHIKYGKSTSEMTNVTPRSPYQ